MAGNISDRALVYLARTGYTARGIVYLLVGGLTTLAVVGQGGQTTGSPGALKSVLTAPLGTLLLLLLALGLVSYALWRSVQAIQDTDHHGTTPKGIAIRLGLGGSAVAHLVLAAFAATVITSLGSSSGGSGESTQNAVDWLTALWPLAGWRCGARGGHYRFISPFQSLEYRF